MPLSLHAAFVPGALQMLGSARHLVGRAEAWCSENGCDAAELIGARLIDDMFAFDYQVKSVAVHTQGAVDGVRAGLFAPDMAPPPESFEALRPKASKRCARSSTAPSRHSRRSTRRKSKAGSANRCGSNSAISR